MWRIIKQAKAVFNTDNTGSLYFAGTVELQSEPWKFVLNMGSCCLLRLILTPDQKVNGIIFKKKKKKKE